MTWLLDANVLVALAINTHVHHATSRRWLASHADPFATCSVTQGALLRIHMTMATDRSAIAAWRTLDAITRLPRHRYWAQDLPYAEIKALNIQGPKQVTDAWLAEFARRHQARLVTFDSALAALHPDVASLLGADPLN